MATVCRSHVSYLRRMKPKNSIAEGIVDVLFFETL